MNDRRFLARLADVATHGFEGNYFSKIFMAIRELLPTTAGSFWIHNRASSTLSLAGLEGDSDLIARVPAGTPFATTSLIARVIREGRRFHLMTGPQETDVADDLESWLLTDCLLIGVAGPQETMTPDDYTAVVQLYLGSSIPSDIEAIAELVSIQIHSLLETRKLQAQATITRTLINLVDREEPFARYLAAVVRYLRDVIAAEACSVFLFRDHERILSLAATTAVVSEPEFNRIRYVLGEGITGKVGETGQAFLAANVDPRRTAGIFLETDRRRPLHLLAVPIPGANGRTLGVLRCVGKRIFVAGDVSVPFSEMDLQAVRVAAAILGLLCESREADIRMERVLEDISHEVRSPLAGLRGRASLLRHAAREGRIDPATFELKLRDIEDITELVTVLIEGVNVLREGPAAYLFRPTLLFGDVIIKWVHLLTPIAREKRMSIRYEGETIVPSLWMDGRRFEQVAFNLIMNAIKYGYVGTDITISASVQPQLYEIKIQDFGLPISPATYETIFLRGFRAPEAVTKSPVGKGLGLAVVRHVVAAHGGKAYVGNGSGMPTEFVLQLPRWLERRGPLDPLR